MKTKKGIVGEMRLQNQENGGMMVPHASPAAWLVEIWSFGKVPLGQSPKEAIKMIDKDKVKAALEKRRKSRGGIYTEERCDR